MPRRTALALLVAALAALAALWLDPLAYRYLAAPDLDRHDWARMLRVMGTLWFWGPLAAVFWLESPHHAPLRRWSATLLAAPAIAGLLAEALKLLIRRERPSLHHGEYFYRPFAQRPFDSHDLGFPSSHVMVAFAGAAVIARRYPRAGWIAYTLAIGCAATRLLAGAHFLSDAVGAALGGWAVAVWVSRRFPMARESG